MTFPTILLYIGAWNHIAPVLHFPKTKEFIYIDTQPRSEFDQANIFMTCFYRKKFYKNVVRIWSQYGFNLLSTTIIDKNYEQTLVKDTSDDDITSKKTYKHVNPTLLYFSNPVTNQVIKYYISTNIKFNMCNRLEKDIRKSDGLIISGYFPTSQVLDYLPHSNYTFYCYTDTCYSYDQHDNNIMNSFHHSSYQEMNSNHFIIMDKHSGKQLHTCNTIQEVELCTSKL